MDGDLLQEIHRDVIVLGAGWSGLVSCKYMLEEGLSVITLEKKTNIGGVWLYTDDPTVPSVMKSTQCTSSSTATEMSDYPMPIEIGMFPHHTDMLAYMQAYAEEFNLLPNIKLNSTVKEVEKKGDTWRVTCSTGDVYTSTYLVVAAGVLQEPNRELEKTTLKGFTGNVLHACEVKKTLDEFKNSRLLLLGGGETGSDICMEWFDHTQFIYWSIPRGQHFFRKYAKPFPWAKPLPLDKASSRMLKAIVPYTHSKPGLSWFCKWTTNGSLLAYQGHGIPEWKNDSNFFKFFVNKNGKVLDLVDYKRVVPKGGILECNGKEVTFIDGTKQEFDLVIMSTGYKVGYHYLPKCYRVGIRDRYKMVLDVEDPSLAFVGLVRPVVLSVVSISELQARWAAKVFSGKVPLKPLEERRQDVKLDTAHWSEYFKHTSQRIEGLVESFTYTDDIAHLAQIYPDYWALFKKSPKQWFVASTAPFNGATYRLNEPEKLEQCIKTMRSHQMKTKHIFLFLLFIFLRCIWFDWWMDKIGWVKYQIQLSFWWPTVRSWQLTKGLNYIWTFPKRCLFDKVSSDVNEMSSRAKLLMMSQSYARKHLINGSADRTHPPSIGTQPRKR